MPVICWEVPGLTLSPSWEGLIPRDKQQQLREEMQISGFTVDEAHTKTEV